MSTPATSSALAGSAILSLQTKRTERYDDYRRIVVESKSAEALHAALDELLAPGDDHVIGFKPRKLKKMGQPPR